MNIMNFMKGRAKPDSKYVPAIREGMVWKGGINRTPPGPRPPPPSGQRPKRSAGK